MSEPIRDVVFLSYSHKDQQWLDSLQIVLAPLTEISCWSDVAIKPGDKWFPEIEEAVSRASVAVLLVSSDFLASTFIMEEEWPRIKEAEIAGELKVLWIPIRPSLVSETEIAKYQALHEPKTPLSGLPAPAQEAALVEICKKIKFAAKPQIRKPAGRESTEIAAPAALEPFRTIETQMASVSLCAVDGHSRLWVSNGRHLKKFQINQHTPVANWPLPNTRWKQSLQVIWRNHAVFSDWDGSLYTFDGESRHAAAPLYAARHNDLPIHLIAVGPEGQLVAAAWNGIIRTWDPVGQLRNADAPIAIPFLPIHLMPLPNHFLGVVDQANWIRLFDAEGRECWSWQADAPVRASWGFVEADRIVFVAQLGRNKIAKITRGSDRPAIVEFSESIENVAIDRGNVRGDVIVVARQGGKVDWLFSTPSSLARDSGAAVPLPVREIAVIRDAHQPASLLALGLGDDNRLFAINDQSVTTYTIPRPGQRFLLDPTGRFVFVLTRDRIDIYRNPALASMTPQIAQPSVSGTLMVNVFKRVRVRLTNNGAVAIHGFNATMHANDIIDQANSKKTLDAPVAPGESIELEFLVRARVSGDLPLRLRVELADEGGSSGYAQEWELAISSVSA
jgi:hypothetical protein